jgi:hypothetical protein
MRPYDASVGTFTLKQAGVRLPRELGGAVRKVAFDGLVSAAHKIVQLIDAEIIPSFGDRMPVDRGAYRAGFRVLPVRAEGKVVIRNSAPHAVFIEEGVRAANVKISRQMIENLAEWVRRKGIGGRTVTSKSGKERLVKASAAEATAIAWAIAKSMQEKGIFDKGRGLHVMRRAEAHMPEVIRREVEAELRKVK